MLVKRSRRVLVGKQFTAEGGNNVRSKTTQGRKRENDQKKPLLKYLPKTFNLRGIMERRGSKRQPAGPWQTTRGGEKGAFDRDQNTDKQANRHTCSNCRTKKKGERRGTSRKKKSRASRGEPPSATRV